uniref:Uncharacterized protein n=1 Tax=Photinus pyralis TaxID=7054 RepID=A0A1Y1K1W8_PHOPY
MTSSSFSSTSTKVTLLHDPSPDRSADFVISIPFLNLIDARWACCSAAPDVGARDAMWGLDFDDIFATALSYIEYLLSFRHADLVHPYLFQEKNLSYLFENICVCLFFIKLSFEELSNLYALILEEQ